MGSELSMRILTAPTRNPHKTAAKGWMDRWIQRHRKIQRNRNRDRDRDRQREREERGKGIYARINGDNTTAQNVRMQESGHTEY